MSIEDKGSPFGQIKGYAECEHGLCESCGTPLVFMLRCGEQEIPVDLLTLLRCLKIASQEGHIPKIPEKWWIDVVNYSGGAVR